MGKGRARHRRKSHDPRRSRSQSSRPDRASPRRDRLRSPDRKGLSHRKPKGPPRAALRPAAPVTRYEWRVLSDEWRAKGNANRRSTAPTPGVLYGCETKGVGGIAVCKNMKRKDEPIGFAADAEKSEAHRGVHESVWQLCCLGEFLVISMIHLHSSEVVARGGLDFLCAGYFQWGLRRHMRVRFNAVV